MSRRMARNFLRDVIATPGIVSHRDPPRFINPFGESDPILRSLAVLLALPCFQADEVSYRKWRIEERGLVVLGM